MDLEYCIGRLASTLKVFEGLFGNVSEDQARWKPGADKWSLLEVINHLADEEESIALRIPAGSKGNIFDRICRKLVTSGS